MRALVPEDLTTGRAIAERATKSLARALLASARALALPDRDPMQVAQAEWSHDDATRTILRAAVAPASTANAANAVLLETAVAGVVLGGVGAGADLLRRGLVLSFGRSASIKLPALIADATHGAFVAEDGVIPAYQESTASPPTLVPHKLCGIWTMTNEMLTGSNAEALITEAARRSIGLALDFALFDAASGEVSAVSAATPERSPAGRAAFCLRGDARRHPHAAERGRANRWRRRADRRQRERGHAVGTLARRRVAPGAGLADGQFHRLARGCYRRPCCRHRPRDRDRDQQGRIDPPGGHRAAGDRLAGIAADDRGAGSKPFSDRQRGTEAAAAGDVDEAPCGGRRMAHDKLVTHGRS
jgi:hypothetical protein